MKKSIIYLLLLFTAANQLLAQRTTTLVNPNSNPPVQLSFVYPISTSGWSAIHSNHGLSVHLLAGATGSTEGVELAGFANFNKSTLKGVQAAGFANYLGGEARGVQAAGFANVAIDSIAGVQAAGFANYSHGNSGTQAAGFANVNTGRAQGLQAAGFANVTIQESKGGQVAGFANVSTGRSVGVQVSGFLNFANKHTGLQVSVLNYADSLDGIAIGLFSYSKNGYHKFEVSSNETFQTNIAFRTGSRTFYNIFNAGVHWDKSEPAWSLGYGIGTTVLNSSNWSADLDLISNALFPQDFESDEWANVNTLRVSVVKKFNLLEVFAGASVNGLLSSEKDQFSGITPWTAFEGVEQGTHYKIYPGFQFGVRI